MKKSVPTLIGFNKYDNYHIKILLKLIPNLVWHVLGSLDIVSFYGMTYIPVKQTHVNLPNR